MYQVGLGAPWDSTPATVGYRSLPNAATYSAASPYNSSHGRFDNGVRYTIYYADTAEGASAEFLRRHPEFLQHQDRLTISVYELEIALSSHRLDVTTAANATSVGIDVDRLTSSDDDEGERYQECRDLADEVEARGTGILYPSAAFVGGENTVLFGQPSAATWSVTRSEEVGRPTVDPSKVVTLG